MTRRRKLIISLILVPILLVVLLVGALFTSVVQTKAARRALAGKGGVEHVSIGMGGASLRGLNLDQAGVKISVPAFDADVPLFDLASGKILVRRLVARDLVVDYDPVAAAEYARTHPESDEAATASKPFAGLLKALALPGGLAVDGVDVSGVLRVAGPQPMQVQFTLKGGELRAGHQGRFDLNLNLKPDAKTDVAAVLALLPTLDAAGQLSAVTVHLDATSSGGFLKQPATLRTELSVAQEGTGEAWGFRVIAGDKRLIDLDTRWIPGAQQVPGRWKIALTDADLAPFLPVLVTLPTLKVVGEGEITVSAATASARVSGGLQVAADSLETLGLPALGPITLDTRFDVDGGAAQVRVAALKLDLAAATTPVLAVEAKQPFGFDTATQKVTSARPTDELLSVNLLGVPAAWLAAFVPDLALNGPVTAAWSVRPEGDGVLLQTTAPLVLPAVRYGPADAPLVAFDSIRLEGLRVRQSPSGMDADSATLRFIVGGADLATVQFSAVKKPDLPAVAHAEIQIQLAELVAQPPLRGKTRLSSGQAVVMLDATVGDTVAGKLGLRLAGLRGASGAAELPEVVVQADFTRDPAGRISLKVPVAITDLVTKRVSDLELAVNATPATPASGVPPDWKVDSKLISQALHLSDFQAFTALAADAPVSTTPAPTPIPEPAVVPSAPAATEPLWAGVTGSLELALARILVLPGIEIINTAGRVALTRQELTLASLKLLLGTGGTVQLGGGLRWVAPTGSYALSADVQAADLAAGPLLKALDPTAKTTALEGTFGLTAKLVGQGSDPASAASGAAMDVKLTGRAGVLRALNLDTNAYARLGGSETLGQIAGAFGAAFGEKSEVGRRAKQVAAVNAFARRLGNLPYDEFTLNARRDASGAVEIEALRLVSPEILLNGGGGVQNLPGRDFLDQPLTLKLALGAGGETARNLAVLGLLKPAAATGDTTANGASSAPIADYAPFIEPIVLGGTVSEISTDQLKRLINRVLGL